MAERKRKARKHVWRHLGGPMLVDRNDDRYGEYMKALKRDGVAPDETWGLDMTIALFVLPRLKLFREVTNGYPWSLGSMDKWQGVLGRMVDAFELIAEDRVVYSDDERTRIEDGLDMFRKWFHELWW